MRKSKVAPTLCSILCVASILTILCLAPTAFRKITKSEIQTVEYLLYGICGESCCDPDKKVQEWIEEGWTVTDMSWDGCGNITVEFEK